MEPPYHGPLYVVGCGHVFTAEPDNESLIDCPNCGMWFGAGEENVTESTKPRLEWLDEDTAKVFVQSHHIADLSWNTIEWHFIPFEFEPHQQLTVHYWSWIKVDTEHYAELRKRINDQRAVAHEQPEAIRAANNAELESQCRDFRDATKEFAEMAAVGKARIWWRTMYGLWVQGCTGGTSHFGGEITHDAQPCPVHNP
jgi:hypothetical protein